MKISIITVAYNSERTVYHTLKSIAEQVDVDLEYIFIDGGSSDNTVNIVNSFPGLVSHFVSEADGGIYDAMNKGLALATGQVVGILNSDDYYAHPRVLSNIISVFNSNEFLDAVFGEVHFICENKPDIILRKINSNHFRPWMLRFGFMPPHPASFVTKSVYARVGNYKVDYKIAADFEFFVRMLLVFRGRYKSIDQCLVRMQMGGVSTSGWRSNVLITKEMMRALVDNNIFTCKLMLLARLPIKYIKQIFLRILY